MRKVIAYRRPLLDLKQIEMLLIAASLLSLRMPPGIGILIVIIVGLVHWHMKKNAKTPIRELLHAHRGTDDPTIRQQLAIYIQAWIAEQKGELSEDQRKEWYSVGGFLLLTIPKPSTAPPEIRRSFPVGSVKLPRLSTLHPVSCRHGCSIFQAVSNLGVSDKFGVNSQHDAGKLLYVRMLKRS